MGSGEWSREEKRTEEESQLTTLPALRERVVWGQCKIFLIYG